MERRLFAPPGEDRGRPSIRPHDLMVFELAAAQGLAAEPMGGRRGGHDPDDARDLAGMEERQQVGSELDAVAGIDDALDAENCRRALLGDGLQVVLEYAAVRIAPAVEKALAAQLRAEHLAQPRAGEPELIGPRIGALEHERF